MRDLRLVRTDISPDIIIPENYYLTLVIENKEFMYKFVTELRCQMEKGDYEVFSFIINGQSKPFTKYVSAIFDLTNIDLNTKPIINMITKKLGAFLTDNTQMDNKSRIESNVMNILEDFKSYSGFKIDYDVVLSESSIVKIANLHVSSDDKICLLERLCDYLDIIVELIPVRLLIVAFLKEYLDEEQISQFNKYCISKDCNLLLIESSCSSERYLDERLYIIDKDLCIITKNE